MRTLIANAKIRQEGKDIIRHIIIEKGKIVAISRGSGGMTPAYDARGNYVIPGMIDPHVHFRYPGMTEKEDWEHASRAAASGGIVAVVDMPNTQPPLLTTALLDEKHQHVKRHSLVDYGFHFGASADNLDEVSHASRRPFVASTKVFLNLSTGRMLIEDDATLEEAFRRSRMVFCHAEDDQVWRAIGIALRTGARLYLCHISQAKELAYLRKARRMIHEKGLRARIVAEATPHHLFLNDADAKRLKGFGMMKPPLRPEKDRRALMRALLDGTIDTVGTDHAPHTLQEKKGMSPPYGVPGVETALPLLLDLVNRGRLSLERLVRLTSSGPAQALGIRGKGSLAVGMDADLVMIDMDLSQEVETSRLLSKCGWSPFAGKVLKGWPIATFIRGTKVYELSGGRKVIASRHRGRPLTFA
ncbi:dihydroorotase family protein [Candidatus Woesearchaeota archaeon]|nr:dihydroorotase family protein [Candidatus Woesearchaeota archaeon]